MGTSDGSWWMVVDRRHRQPVESNRRGQLRVEEEDRGGVGLWLVGKVFKKTSLR